MDRVARWRSYSATVMDLFNSLQELRFNSLTLIASLLETSTEITSLTFSPRRRPIRRLSSFYKGRETGHSHLSQLEMCNCHVAPILPSAISIRMELRMLFRPTHTLAGCRSSLDKSHRQMPSRATLIPLDRVQTRSSLSMQATPTTTPVHQQHLRCSLRLLPQFYRHLQGSIHLSRPSPLRIQVRAQASITIFQLIQLPAPNHIPDPSRFLMLGHKFLPSMPLLQARSPVLMCRPHTRWSCRKFRRHPFLS